MVLEMMFTNGAQAFASWLAQPTYLAPMVFVGYDCWREDMIFFGWTEPG
jgi:hypothetical protein